MNPRVQILCDRFFARYDRAAVLAPWGTPCPVDTIGVAEQALLAHLEGKHAAVVQLPRMDEPDKPPLVGRFRMGSYVPGADGNTPFVCIDVDGPGHAHAVADPLAAALAIKTAFEAHGTPLFIEMSGGGAGWHIWVFFDPPLPAVKARSLALSLIPRDILLADGRCADPQRNIGIEIFPKQTYAAPEGFGNLVWLPWWSGAKGDANQFHLLNGDGTLHPYMPESFTTIDEAAVDRLLAEIVSPTVPAPSPKASPAAPQSENRPEDCAWHEWRRRALAALPLEQVYGEWLTGKKNGEWLECRDPESKSGDQHPSAGVADGSGKAERGEFHSFISARTISVFDFLVEQGHASDFKDACRIIADRSGVALPKSGPPPRAGNLPQVQINNRQMRDVIADAWSALGAANADSPILFRRLDHLVRLGDRDGTVVLSMHNETSMHGVLLRTADWIKVGDQAVTSVSPPKDVAKDFLEYPDDNLPVLNRVICAPVFADSGQLIQTPGYHARERIYLALPANFKIDTIPDAPNRSDIVAARDLILNDLLGDFPFAGNADRAHIVAAMLLTFVRLLIAGCTPLHSIESPTPGSGKGLLCKLISILAEGDVGRSLTLPAGDDEVGKKLTAELRDGRSVILLDNAPERRRIDSASLASALTSLIWSDRLLKESRIVALPNQALWLMTANNPSFSMEIARRAIRIRINPKMDQPWLRSGFRHADLEKWALGQRGRLVAALLTLVRAWIVAGRPTAKGTPRLGTFEEWSDVIGGILATAGIPGFLGNVDEFYATGDAEGQMWREFVDAWHREDGGAPRRISDLNTFCERADLMVSVRGEGTEKSQQTRLGLALQRSRDRVFGTFQVVLDQDRGNKGKSYRLLSTSGQDGAQGGTLAGTGNLGSQGSPQGSPVETDAK